MNAKGLRILDKTGKVSSVSLSDLLKEIDHGAQLHWLVAFFYATGNLADGTPTTALEHQINEAEYGLFLTWDELNAFAQKYIGLRDLTLMGAKNKENLIRYPQNALMYEACDIVIEKVESAYWELFSANLLLIEKLAAKFQQTEPLEPDFLKEEDFSDPS